MAVAANSGTSRTGALLLLMLTFLHGPETCLASNKFLSEHGASVSSKAFQEEIMNAVGSMLGCGGEADRDHVESIRSVMMPMWRTLPKTQNRIDRRSLRYLVHRYYMQTSSMMVRGFEPSRSVNDSHWGAADVLSQMVPAYVEAVLESQHNTQHGFSLQDAVDMALMLDQLILDSESSLLEGVYRDQRKPLHRSLSYNGLKQVLEAYMVKWMIDVEPEDHKIIHANRTLAAEVMPHYTQVMEFAEGRIKAFEYKRQMAGSSMMKSSTEDAWTMRYSVHDAHQIVGGITRSFQSFWQSECESMKSALVGMDAHGTGRVPLAKFYNTAINTDWRFGESESYLRELGALDDSSSWMGPQVIIPNYLQATSNCIVSRPHYLVCCVNECESLLSEIEVAINAPTALPSAILAVVGNMTVPTTLDREEPPHVNAALKSQLQQVAKNHGGMVPLHGRLFAQWLHYVFPRECPFPHKVGVATSMTPTEFGDSFAATKEDMRKHASNSTALDITASVGKEELQWMSQWSPDEELMVDYSSELGISGQGRLLFIVVGALIAVGGFWGGVVGFGNAKGNQMAAGSVPHSHWV